MGLSAHVNQPLGSLHRKFKVKLYRSIIVPHSNTHSNSFAEIQSTTIYPTITTTPTWFQRLTIVNLTTTILQPHSECPFDNECEPNHVPTLKKEKDWYKEEKSIVSK